MKQLAQQLGTLRQPVQDALTLLRKEDVLIDAPGRGLQEATLDLDQVRQMHDVRAMTKGCRSSKRQKTTTRRPPSKDRH